jgi:membrane-bound lytic murein transglycosylase D
LNVLRGLGIWLMALWLAGCASVAPGPESTPTEPAPLASTPIATPDPSLPGLRQPIYPSGELRPLTAQQIASFEVRTLTPPSDIWDRIRRGFAMPNLDNNLVRDREQWYINRPDYIGRMTERGSKYLFYIVEELERRNMPSELALLPFIESAFNPQAVSSAKAAGMWQFMPATGKYFDLKQNMFRDDRRDVLASTRAALDYFQKLYEMFGDWHLALAAYNWGEGNVGKAIAKNQKAGRGTGYADLKMPMETQLYVPKLQAVKNIVATPLALGVSLPLIENHPYFDTVEIDRDIDVDIAAKLAEVSVEDFRALNPSATKPVLLAAATPQILLPWDNAKQFQLNLQAFSEGNLASWTAWVAPRTLNSADAAKQVGMKEVELRQVNNIPRYMLIRAGSVLVVRRSGGLNKDISNHLADNGQLRLTPEIALRKTVVKARNKESVASLAKRYSVGVDAVAQWNKVSTTAVFKNGQSVVVFLPVKSRPVAKASSQRSKSKAKRTAPASKSKKLAKQ